MDLLSDSGLLAPLRVRSNEPEWLDDLSIRGPELEESLRDLELSNRFLGGHRALLKSLDRALPWLPQRRLRLVDIGCGRGDGLRAIARWSARRNIPFELIGVDANEAVIEEARRQSKKHPNIRYVAGDAFGRVLGELAPDVVTANLFFHHFSTEALSQRLPALLEHSRVVIISDLHRHPVAHAGFRAITRLVRACAMTRHDGAVSIRRAFTRDDLERLVAPLGLHHWSVNWSLAFRYGVLLVRDP